MEENYEMDLLTKEERQFFQDQDLEEFADPDGYITVGAGEREERVIAMSSAKREKMENDYKDLLWKQGAEIELLTDENEKLRKNLQGQGTMLDENEKLRKNLRQSQSSAEAVGPLRAETSRLMKNLSESETETRRHMSLLSKQREIIESLKASHRKMEKDKGISETALKQKLETIDRLIKSNEKGNYILDRQEKIINALQRENKILRDAEWIRLENEQLKKTESKSTQTERWLDVTDDIIKKMQTTPVEELPADEIFTLRRSQEIWDIRSLFTDILDLEPQTVDKDFLNYLMNEKGFQINASLLTSQIDYSVRYLENDYQTIDRQLTDSEAEFLRQSVRSQYDEFYEKRNRLLLKKSGIITAIGLSIIALVTGLSVGLSRKGANIVHQSKKWEKLRASEPVDISWTNLTDATGKSLIFTGKYLTVILLLSGSYLIVKSIKKK